jgi:hypothetical protein
MTWVVEARYRCGTFVRHFDTATAAHGWEFLMTSHGYQTTVAEPVRSTRHLKVVNGGRRESCVGSTAPAAEGA